MTKSLQNVIFTETWKKGIAAGRKIAGLFEISKEEIPLILKNELIAFLCLPKNNFRPENLEKFLKLIPGKATEVFTTAFENALLNYLEGRAKSLLSLNILTKEEQCSIAKKTLGEILKKEETIAPELEFIYGFLLPEEKANYAKDCIVKSWKKGEIVLKKINCFLENISEAELAKAVRDLIIFHSESKNYEKAETVFKTIGLEKEKVIDSEIKTALKKNITELLHKNQIAEVEMIMNFGFLEKNDLATNKIFEAAKKAFVLNLKVQPPAVSSLKKIVNWGMMETKSLTSIEIENAIFMSGKEMIKNSDPETVSKTFFKPLQNLGTTIDEALFFENLENISIIKNRLIKEISDGTIENAIEEIKKTKLPKKDFEETVKKGLNNRLSNGNLHFAKSLLENNFLSEPENNLHYIAYRKSIKEGFVACFKNSYFNIVEEIVEMDIFDEGELYDHVVIGLKEAFNNCDKESFKRVEVLLFKIKKRLPPSIGKKIDDLPILKKIAENRANSAIREETLRRANKKY